MQWSVSRDPALLGAVLLAIVQLILTLTRTPPEYAALTNAVVSAAVGFGVALWVRSDRLVPAFLGLIKAVGALVIGLGLAWSTADQAAVMVLAVALTAAFTRSQCTAPVRAQVVPIIKSGTVA